MKIQCTDMIRQYEQLYQLPLKKRQDYFRYEMMGSFEPMWSTIQVPMKPAVERGYDVIMACEMLGLLALDEDERGLAALDLIKEYDVQGTVKNSLEECFNYIERQQLRIDSEQLQAGIFLANPEKLQRHHGYSGFGGIPGFIQLYLYPNEYNLNRLPALVAHEFHHNVRFSYFDWNHGDVTLGEYMVIEGLAESFASELYGEERIGPWVTCLDEDDFAYSIEIMRTTLHKKGFADISAYMFGDLQSKEGRPIPSPIIIKKGARAPANWVLFISFRLSNQNMIFRITDF